MHVISKKRLKSFWEDPKNPKDSQKYLSAWYKVADLAVWDNFAALRNTFGSADVVGNCVVFDVGNNRYRVIGRIIYTSGRLYILKVMKHDEYDANDWPTDCGCYRPPPPRATRPPRKKA